MSSKLLLSFLILNIYLDQNAANSVKKNYMDMIKTFETLESLDNLKFLNTTLCGIHLTEYASSLKLEQYWALQMFDSSAKIPYSILMGNRRILGNYDECLEVEHPDHHFTGQHCMITVNITVDVNEGTQMKDAVDHKQNSEPFSYGVCVPSTCTAKDIMSVLNNSTNDTTSELPIILNQEECFTKNQPKELRLIDWIAIAVLSAFGIIALLSTSYDIYHKFYSENAKPHPLLMSFSMYSNGKNLFKTTKSSEHMKPLDGMRVLSTCWIVLLHTKILLGNHSINPLKALTDAKDASQVELTFGHIAVDTFFFLSGFLVCMVFFRNISKKGYYDVPLQYIHRYIRLTPSFAAIILIIVSILIYLGDGPMWISSTKKFIQMCDNHWWGGISYLSTLIHQDGICLAPSWYIATDMQLYFLSPLILFPLYFWPSFSMFFLMVIITASACASFAITYLNNLDPRVIPIKHNRGKMDYVRFYTRSSPYLIGIATGYIFIQIKARNITLKLNKVFVFAGWLMSTGLCLGSLYGIIPFQISRHSSLENGLYISLHRVAWGFGMAWIVLACLNGYGGPVNKFLSWKFFQPLSKLSYNIYLLHWVVIVYKYGTMRTIAYLGNTETTFDMLSHLMISMLLSIPFTLLFEMPFGNLDSYLFQNVKILPFPKQRNMNEPEKEMEGSHVSDEDNEKITYSERF